MFNEHPRSVAVAVRISNLLEDWSLDRASLFEGSSTDHITGRNMGEAIVSFERVGDRVLAARKATRDTDELRFS